MIVLKQQLIYNTQLSSVRIIFLSPFRPLILNLSNYSYLASYNMRSFYTNFFSISFKAYGSE